MSASQGSRRSAGRPFKPGQSGNPAGRPKAQKGFTERARELSLPILENMAKVAITGRGAPAVQAAALVLAYSHGKPTESLHLVASRGPDGAIGGDPDQARRRLELLIAGEIAAVGTGPQSLPALKPGEPNLESRAVEARSPTENGPSGGDAGALGVRLPVIDVEPVTPPKGGTP